MDIIKEITRRGYRNIQCGVISEIADIPAFKTMIRQSRLPLNYKGVYVFMAKNQDNIVDVIYVGSSKHIRRRLLSNPIVSSAIISGFKNITVFYKHSDDHLFDEEFMIRKYQPEFNTQHKGWWCDIDTYDNSLSV